VNYPTVTDVFLSSAGKLFHADGPAAEKLRGLKPTVLVLGVFLVSNTKYVDTNSYNAKRDG